MPNVCRLGDKARIDVDTHGGPCCPHAAIGPAISASSNVLVNGIPALRLGDIGMAAPCCGSSIWKVVQASGGVFINGSAMVRKGDIVQSCGGIGKMIEASGTVTDNSAVLIGGPFALGLPPIAPLPLNQVKVFPSAIPFCPTPEEVADYPGLPLSGDPQIYDQNAAVAQRNANLPHAEALAPGQREADAERNIANDKLLGVPPDPIDQNILDESRHETSRLEREIKTVEKSLKLLNDGTSDYLKKRREAEERLDELRARLQLRRALPGYGGSDGEESDAAESDGRAEDAVP
jgi:uncharacterized Zn-binding protein involved in type VI secretion